MDTKLQRYEELTALLTKAQTLIDELRSEVVEQHQDRLYYQCTVHPSEHVTATGRIRNLHTKILNKMRECREPMTTAELARSLFDEDYGMSFDIFKRRVSVATSYLAANKGTLHQHRGELGEVLWYLANRPLVLQEDAAPNINGAIIHFHDAMAQKPCAGEVRDGWIMDTYSEPR